MTLREITIWIARHRNDAAPDVVADADRALAWWRDREGPTAALIARRATFELGIISRRGLQEIEGMRDAA